MAGTNTLAYLALCWLQKGLLILTPIYEQSLSVCIIKFITAIIYSFCNMLESLTFNTRLGWKGLPGTNTLAYLALCWLQKALLMLLPPDLRTIFKCLYHKTYYGHNLRSS
jgi:hypothetical protein